MAANADGGGGVMGKEIINDIHTRVPVNHTAAAVVLGKGVHFIPNKIITTGDSELPIPTKPLTRHELSQPQFVDLTGKKFGRFTVIGKSRDHGARWVVRCSCGKYSLRKTKAINNPSNAQDRCEECRHLAHLKREQMWRATGRNQDIRNF